MLWTVIAINAVMFVVEIVAGHMAGSQALQADASDFLGDTLTYGLSLAVIGASNSGRAQPRGDAQGLSLTRWALGVRSTAYHVLVLGVPRAEIMGVIGLWRSPPTSPASSCYALQGRRRQRALGLAVLAQ